MKVNLHPPKSYEVLSLATDKAGVLVIEPIFRSAKADAVVASVTIVGDQGTTRSYTLFVDGGTGKLRVQDNSQSVKAAFDEGAITDDGPAEILSVAK